MVGPTSYATSLVSNFGRSGFKKPVQCGSNHHEGTNHRSSKEVVFKTPLACGKGRISAPELYQGDEFGSTTPHPPCSP